MTGRRHGTGAPLLVLGFGCLAALLLVTLSAAWRLAPDLGHGWAAPLLIGYLYWERWGGRPPARPEAAIGPLAWIGALLAVGASVPLRLLLVPFPLWPGLVWADALLLAGCALAAAGFLAGPPGIRWLAGPLVILGGALPWPSGLDRAVILPLRQVMAQIAAEISNLAGQPALAEGTSVRLGHDWVGVEEACGGIRSLQAAVMVALFLGEWRRFGWRRRLGLVAVGVAAAVLGNFSRILVLALRAGGGPEAAQSVHDLAGWLALALTLGLTGAAAWAWGRNSVSNNSIPRAPGPAAWPRPAARWLAAVAAGLLAAEGAVRWWYARGEAAESGRPRWTARLPEDAADFRTQPLAEGDRDLLRPDFYAAGSWEGGEDLLYSAYYIEWRAGQAARFVPFLHNPTVCLPMAGCELERSLGDFTVHWSGGEIPFHAYIFREAGRDLAVAFAVWDTSRNRPLAADESTDRWSWLRSHWQEVREARRNQPAQMLSVAIAGPGGERRLVSTLESIISSQ